MVASIVGKTSAQLAKQLKNIITKGKKASEAEKVKLRKDYKEVKNALKESEQKSATTPLDKKVPVSDDPAEKAREDIPVIERGERRERAYSSKPSQEAQPLSRAEQSKASKFKSWITTIEPGKTRRKEAAQIVSRGRAYVAANKKIENQLQKTNDPAKIKKLKASYTRNNTEAQNLRNKWTEFKERKTVKGVGMKETPLETQVKEEKRVSLEQVEPLAKGRRGREQLATRQIGKTKARQALTKKVNNFLRIGGKITKIPEGKQTTAGAPDDMYPALKELQDALGVSSGAKSIRDRKAVRGEKKFSEATPSQITGALRAGSPSALQGILSKQKRKSPKTWRQVVKNLKDAPLRTQRLAAKLGIIRQSSIKEPEKKITGGRTPPKKQIFKSKPTRKQYAKINEAIDEGQMAYERAVNRKKVDIKSLTPTERKAFLKSITKRKKGGKVLKTKVKRKTTAPRKRAALRGYGAALRGF